MEHKDISILLGFSAGIIIYISFSELLFVSIRDIGFFYANSAFFLGIIIMAVVDFSIPHEYGKESISKERQDQNMIRTGVIIAIGIAIHNFPEGFVTFFGTLKDVQLGMVLMVAITLHNIPEGISICVPTYCATESRRKAFMLSFLSGIAEPVGAVFGFLLLYPFFNEFLLNTVLAFVAGVMMFISFDELLPLSSNYGKENQSIASLFIGMVLMYLVMLLSQRL
ncbi:MAG: ZIP family metal transporter [Candidatus Thorarchaeota archaeon]|nr:ZIP family metal transporter [Candidatus Thorarchaeota archaeon]NIW13691.1 ZIP family metal transporter [Candidatus Thorarchaeota archaeon]NIW51790.1 ZIP family metal transporter [Candidatus Korarchaeota archaeon]